MKNRTARTLATWICAASVAVSSSAQAQVQETWNQTILNIPAGGIAVSPAGTAAVIGTTLTPQDVVLTVYDATGNLLWTRTFDSGLGIDDSFTGVAFDPTGNIVVASRNYGSVGAGFVADMWLVKYDPSGNLVWSTSYNGGGNGVDYGLVPVVAPNGDIFLAGSATEAATGPDLVVWKYSSAGVFQWIGRANGTQSISDAANSLVRDALGNLYVSGVANNFPKHGSDIFLAKFGPTGALLWKREYSGGGQNFENAPSLALDAAGHVYVAATLQLTTGPDGALLQYDTNGNLLWVRSAVDATRQAKQVMVDPHGHAVILMDSYNAAFAPELEIREYDALGTLRWSRLRPSTNAYGFMLDASGQIFPYGTRNSQAFLARWDDDGNELWIHTIAGYFIGGKLGPEGSLYLTGAVFPNGRVVRWDPISNAFCFGDGSASACPCGNTSATGSRQGCRNSLGLGAKLVESGNPRITNDTYALVASNMPDAPALFFQGTQRENGGAGTIFGDGLSCVSGAIVRLAIEVNTAGASSYPSAGETKISIRGGVVTPGLRTYQVWYRNGETFCTGATYNLSNGLATLWQP